MLLDELSEELVLVTFYLAMTCLIYGLRLLVVVVL